MVKKKRQNDHHEGSSTESSDEMKLSLSPTECPHSKKAIDIAKLRKVLKPLGLAKSCSECEKSPKANGVAASADHVGEDDEDEVIFFDNTLWLCMKCGSQLCGRSKKEHALTHFQVTFEITIILKKFP